MEPSSACSGSRKPTEGLTATRVSLNDLNTELTLMLNLATLAFGLLPISTQTNEARGTLVELQSAILRASSIARQMLIQEIRRS